MEELSSPATFRPFLPAVELVLPALVGLRARVDLEAAVDFAARVDLRGRSGVDPADREGAGCC